MTREEWNPRPRQRPRGGLFLAGVLMLLVGAWQIVIGCAVAGGQATVFSGGGYWYRADSAGWGWANLLIGIAGIALGLALLGATRRLRRLRAKIFLALLVAVVSGTNQCFLVPQYPLWSTLAIAFDVFIIWAVTTEPVASGDEAAQDDGIVRLGPTALRDWHGGTMSNKSFKTAAKRFWSEKRTDSAAALTYYSVLSIFPAILVGTSIIGMLSQRATDEMLSVAEELLPSDAMSIVDSAVTQLRTDPSTAGLMALVGLLAALWAASNYVAAFSRALNDVNGTGETRKWWIVLIVRLVLTILVGALTAVCAIILATGGAVADAIGSAIGGGGIAATIWAWIKWPIIVVLVMVIVALLYWLAPAKRTTFRFRAPGAILAVVLWILASAAFGLYVANFSNYDRTYGTLGGVIVFLVWLWITNLALMFGSEYNVSALRDEERVPEMADEKAVG
ncbi:YihY/virulence factor BrkB family protein [Glycomyces tarimensis]